MPNTLTIYGFGSVTLLSIIAILIDRFLPFTVWWNVLRAVISVPLAAAMFTMGYAEAISQHEKKEEDPDWISFRDRFSPSLRKRISAVIGAFLVVIAYASSGTILNTVITAGILATILGLLAFMRLTHKEKIEEKYDIPDARDIDYNRRLKELKEERKRIEEEEKKEKAKEKKEEE